MFIVIVGGGKIGYYLVQYLLKAGNEIAVVEKNPAKNERIMDDFSVVAITGDGCDPRILEQAGVGRADVIVADTGDDEDNLVICQLAKLRFQVPHTVARVNNPKNEFIFRRLGIDATVSSTEVVLGVIEREVTHRGITPIIALTKSGMEIIEASLNSKSPLIGQRIKEVVLPEQCKILAVLRDDGILAQDDNSPLQAQDLVFSLVSPARLEEIRKLMIGSNGHHH